MWCPGPALCDTNCSKLNVPSREVSATIRAVRETLGGVVMVQAPRPELNCAVCNEPVDLRAAKTNERGIAAHERCSARRQALIRAALAVTLRFTADSPTAPSIN
jgi:hypothetical protein